MEDIIWGAVIAVILGLAIAYIVKAKRAGVKCIGCSAANGCAGHCSDECTIEIKIEDEHLNTCTCHDKKE